VAERRAGGPDTREVEMKRFANAAGVLIAVLIAGALIFHFLGSSGGKAPSGGGHHKDEHAGGAVEMNDAKIAAAGIELVKAASGTLHDTLLLNGILQPNQETLVQVTPRFPGVAREILKRVGDRVEKGELLARIESNQSLTVYELKAPLAGTVIDRQVALGEHVSEQKPTFTIADLSNVWIDFSVYRRDLGRVRVGDTVIVDAEDGGTPIETKISYVSPVGSADTQSALARTVVSNTELRLRPGLFVTGRLLLTAKPVGIAIKASALQTHENRTVVFVRTGDKFEARDVEIGDRDPEQVEVLFGLMEGDVYAAKNSFVIKAELAKGTASHEH
jgi:cobalt-zinc-cadmium efflux system membrane fusion protein